MTLSILQKEHFLPPLSFNPGEMSNITSFLLRASVYYKKGTTGRAGTKYALLLEAGALVYYTNGTMGPAGAKGALLLVTGALSYYKKGTTGRAGAKDAILQG